MTVVLLCSGTAPFTMGPQRECPPPECRDAHPRPARPAGACGARRATEIELVIVNDASTGGALVTARLADDPRVQVLGNGESLGPHGRCNRGIAAGHGDLLAFCDDDDARLPGAAGITAERFDADTAIRVVTAWHQVVHDRTGRTAVCRGPLEYGARQLLWFNFVALPFGVIWRQMFADDLAADPTLPSCEDWDLWLRCAPTRPIATVPHVLYAYHQHGEVRVTRVGSAFVVGRQRFLGKHAAAMTATCR